MAKKAFDKFDADDILNAWIAAMKKGAGSGTTFASAITDLDGPVAKKLRTSIKARLKVGSFSEKAHTASTQVARDVGTICAIMVAQTSNKKVDLDLFQKVRALTKSHPSCPVPAPSGTVGGGGPFCG